MKLSKTTLIIAFTFMLLSVVSMVGSHVPIDVSENNRLNTAKKVENPTKSWAIYSNLETSSDVSYFEFDIEVGETIYVQLFVTTRVDEQSFVPVFALMGPGLGVNGEVPSYVETTGDVLVIEGERSEPGYESFGPSHLVGISKIETSSPSTGTYYIAVYSETTAGHFGLAIGIQESFTVMETIMNPINVLDVYIWQGESWFFIMIPYILTFVVGTYLFNRNMDNPTTEQWGIYLLGILFLSSSVSFTWQMVYNVAQTELGSEIIITIIIISLQAAVASGVLTLARRESIQKDVKAQIRLIFLSLFSLFIWVGLVVGPLLGIIVGISFFIRNLTSN